MKDLVEAIKRIVKKTRTSRPAWTPRRATAHALIQGCCGPDLKIVSGPRCGLKATLIETKVSRTLWLISRLGHRG